MIQRSTFLITGSTGFIGTVLCRYLDAQGVAYIQFHGDLTQPASFPDIEPSTIIHLASRISHRGQWTAAEFNEVNTEGTRRLLEHYPNAKMIYISTKDVIQPGPTDYARSKLAAERLVLSQPENLVLRLPSIFGPGQKQTDKLIPRLIRHYAFGDPCQITSNDQREYLFVDECARQIYAHREEQGIQDLSGILIQNYRLRDIIRALYHDEPLEMTDEEEQLREQLRKTSEEYATNHHS